MFVKGTRLNHESMIAFLIAMATLGLFFILFNSVHRAIWRFNVK